MARHTLIFLVGLLLITTLAWSDRGLVQDVAIGQGPDFLSELELGQKVVLEEEACRFRIRILPSEMMKAVAVMHKVVRVGTDYLILRMEVPGVITTTRIPVYAIGSIVRLEIKKD